MGTRLAVAALLCAGVLRAQAPAPSAADSDGTWTPVLAYYGRLTYQGSGVDLLGLEVMEIRPGQAGGRFRVGTWREAVASSSLLIEFEAGPQVAIPIAARATLVPVGGLLVLMGSGIAWGLQAGGGVIVEPVDRLLLHASVGRRWYRFNDEFQGFATWTLAAGWRLGPRPGGVAGAR